MRETLQNTLTNLMAPQRKQKHSTKGNHINEANDKVEEGGFL